MARGRSPGQEAVRGYDLGRIRLAVPASHSALQLLRGARDEGVEAILVAHRRYYDAIYSRFPWLYSRAIVVESWRDLLSPRVVGELREANAVLVPHASLIEYVGVETLLELELPVLGNRYLLEIEASWDRKLSLLEDAGIDTPRRFSSPREAAEAGVPVIVKLPGAKGGRGYRLAAPGSVERVVGELEKQGYRLEDLVIQEYVVGVRLYSHYFNSLVHGRVELLGMDIRLESNVDGLARVPPRLQEELGLEPSYTVVANMPIVARESLLARVLDYGERFARAVERATGYPAAGPYSLEGIVTENLEYKIFEFSGRIVAGTNVYMGLQTPYASLYWEDPMYMGRRIARELREAAEKGILEKIVT
ncbi:formate--phosphoribosylaminoimidazolecarboxamide ligase [Pyrodictium delaneyi]|uniref:5-formaminoimidazole-4-carboxamide-1-(Beta)-D-ribofuranosyl 5'-monophosphate synthetase n=1 Tax=Pyrodictium delaneyi TaxID=1273541 RepID=A0A211YN42_9CREN|nr:formate--phosphoribosylaminoimidazolecarboxamide ligase [Pyrodictium delaneyi]OWJ54399.1 5-formaminoimidazole-4-carboxamide-1-(beta)-D-ribofuranosyl 5'-monophosphate synthetase [Pyrodictium delaneyi]